MNTETKVEDLTASDDIEFKKKFYLILKSSLSGDEAAHKVLAEHTGADILKILRSAFGKTLCDT